MLRVHGYSHPGWEADSRHCTEAARKLGLPVAMVDGGDGDGRRRRDCERDRPLH